MELELFFDGMGYKGWLNFKTADGRNFPMSPGEANTLLKKGTITKGKVKALFGFAKKGSSQTLVFKEDR